MAAAARRRTPASLNGGANAEKKNQQKTKQNKQTNKTKEHRTNLDAPRPTFNSFDSPFLCVLFRDSKEVEEEDKR